MAQWSHSGCLLFRGQSYLNVPEHQNVRPRRGVLCCVSVHLPRPLCCTMMWSGLHCRRRHATYLQMLLYLIVRPSCSNVRATVREHAFVFGARIANLLINLCVLLSPRHSFYLLLSTQKNSHTLSPPSPLTLTKRVSCEDVSDLLDVTIV